MDRCWFNKFKPKDKTQSSKTKETTGIAKEGKPPTNEEAPSNVTKQKVAAAKQYIENHYKKQMKDLQERKERYVYYNTDTFWDIMIVQSKVTDEFVSFNCFNILIVIS